MTAAYGYWLNTTALTRAEGEALLREQHQRELPPKPVPWGGSFADTLFDMTTPLRERPAGNALNERLGRGDLVITCEHCFRGPKDRASTLLSWGDAGIECIVLKLSTSKHKDIQARRSLLVVPPREINWHVQGLEYVGRKARPDAKAIALAEFVWQLYAGGWGERRIATFLNKQLIPRKRGKTWDHLVVRRLLQWLSTVRKLQCLNPPLSEQLALWPSARRQHPGGSSSTPSPP